MKKIVFLLSCAALLFAGCAKVQDEVVVPEKGKRIETLKADIEHSDTRVGVSIGSGGSTATYSWQSDDKILVSAIFTNELGSIYTKLEGGIRSGSISSSGGTAHFDVTLEDGYELWKYAFYPVNSLSDAAPEGITFGLSSEYYYVEGVTNMPMLGTLTTTSVIFRPVGGLLMVRIENIPTNACLLHFSVEGKKIAGAFPVTGSAGNQHIDVEDFGENWQEMDRSYIDIWFGGESEEGGDPDGGEGGTIGVRSPMTFYIPLPCGKYNNLSFSICGRNADTPLFTRIARMDNNGDGIFSDEEGIEIGRNEVVVAPTLEFEWDQNLPRSITLDMEQYEDDLDENGVLNVDQFDDEIEFRATIKGKYARALEEFDPSLISCQLVNVTNPENIVKTPISSFDYVEDYAFDDDFDYRAIEFNVSIPTTIAGEFKLEVSYDSITPIESFKVKVYPVVPIPASLGEYWEYRDNFARPPVYINSSWFEPYWNKDSDGHVFLKTRVASLRTDALPDYAFRGTFQDEEEGGSFDAFEHFTQITSIPTNAFGKCKYMTGINLPSGITSIGSFAFSECDALTTINLPDGLTSIGNGAFSNCDALATINLPDGLTSIGNEAFSFCSELASIQLPAGVTIGAQSFYYCYNLTSINLDNPVSIGQEAFHGCNGLETLVIGNASIGAKAFNECEGLQNVTIGNKTSGGYATIGDEAFADCVSLSEVNLISVSSIGQLAFARCPLNNITLSDSLTSIGDEAFWASGLTTITIPASVTSIGNGAFAFCQSLNYVVFESSNPPLVDDIQSWFIYYDEEVADFTIYVPSEAVDDYQEAWPAIAGRIQAKPANL